MNDLPQIPALRGAWQADVVMAEHVSWRAGGAATRAYRPVDLADLSACLASLPPQEPVLFVGLGSNLLVRDGGYRGTVILMSGALTGLRFEGDALYVEAGVPTPKVPRYAAQQGRCGGEFLAGIPGTFGGALAMNAGCYGGETWGLVERVLWLGHDGRPQILTPEAFEIGYRHVQRRDGIADGCFAAAWLHLVSGDGAASQARMRSLLDQRRATQPLNQPNAGSVFRNPPGDYAARLIEAAGLKGVRIGGAQVSEKHANFIVNPDGVASATDIEDLIEHVAATVQKATGVMLVREVKIVGERA